MKSNTNLVNYLIEKGVLKSPDIINSFYKIDRKDFIIDEESIFAYIDSPLWIWYWQTISQPSTVAFMLELLNPKIWENILDIWSGSWWTTALLSNIVWKQWIVIWLERIEELVEFWNKNISKYKLNNAKIEKSWRKLGIVWKQFDKILVSAAADTFPNELISQVKKWWIIVIPIRNSIFKVEKWFDGSISTVEYPNFVFVPLIYDK